MVGLGTVVPEPVGRSRLLPARLSSLQVGEVEFTPFGVGALGHENLAPLAVLRHSQYFDDLARFKSLGTVSTSTISPGSRLSALVASVVVLTLVVVMLATLSRFELCGARGVAELAVSISVVSWKTEDSD